MGLLKCPDCGKEFSDRIDTCPNCACPKSAVLLEIGVEKGTEYSSAIIKKLKEKIRNSIETSDYEEAEQNADKLIELDSTDYFAWLVKADVLLKKGGQTDRIKVFKYYKKAFELQSEYDEVQLNKIKENINKNIYGWVDDLRVYMQSRAFLFESYTRKNEFINGIENLKKSIKEICFNNVVNEDELNKMLPTLIFNSMKKVRNDLIKKAKNQEQVLARLRDKWNDYKKSISAVITIAEKSIEMEHDIHKKEKMLNILMEWMDERIYLSTHAPFANSHGNISMNLVLNFNNTEKERLIEQRNRYAEMLAEIQGDGLKNNDIVFDNSSGKEVKQKGFKYSKLIAGVLALLLVLILIYDISLLLKKEDSVNQSPNNSNKIEHKEDRGESIDDEKQETQGNGKTEAGHIQPTYLIEFKKYLSSVEMSIYDLTYIETLKTEYGYRYCYKINKVSGENSLEYIYFDDYAPYSVYYGEPGSELYLVWENGESITFVQKTKKDICDNLYTMSLQEQYDTIMEEVWGMHSDQWRDLGELQPDCQEIVYLGDFYEQFYQYKEMNQRGYVFINATEIGGQESTWVWAKTEDGIICFDDSPHIEEEQHEVNPKSVNALKEYREFHGGTIDELVFWNIEKLYGDDYYVYSYNQSGGPQFYVKASAPYSIYLYFGDYTLVWENGKPVN